MSWRKYFKDYREFIIDRIKKNKIEVIYIIKPLDIGSLEGVFDKKCLQKSGLDENIKIHLIVKCNDLK